MQLRNTLFITLFFFSFALNAESIRPPDENPQGYISRLGQTVFSTGGSAFLPLNVLSSLKNGQISPILQFVLLNNVMNQCIDHVVKKRPAITTPFVVADEIWNAGVCKISHCYQQLMIISLLSEASENQSYGGGNDNANAQGLAMLQAFTQQGGCDKKNPNDKGIDPAYSTLFAGP